MSSQNTRQSDQSCTARPFSRHKALLSLTIPTLCVALAMPMMTIVSSSNSAFAQDNGGWNDLNTQSDPIFNDDGGAQAVPAPEPVIDMTPDQNTAPPQNDGGNDLFGNGPGAEPQWQAPQNDSAANGQQPDTQNNADNAGNDDFFNDDTQTDDAANNGFDDGDDPFAPTTDKDGRDANGDIIAGPNTVIDPETGDPVTQEEDNTRVANRIAVLNGLDKITGNITTFDVYVDETVQFGVLQVTPRVCYTSPPSQTPKTDAFLEVDEQTLDRSIRRIFTGWMFADSPGLNALEHPVYDIWLKGCKMDSDVPAPDGMAAVQTTNPDGSAGDGTLDQLGPEAIPESLDPASIPIPERRPNFQSVGG